MPASPPITTSENLPGGILLVEEYNALAVAITSALRKFAPLHRVVVARTFAEAKALAARMRPELFVLDVDPPPFGELEFLNECKAQYPEARMLVIAAGTSSELRAERGTGGAIQFIEKPFDLAEFGAAVQALVGPWTGPTGKLRGTLRDLNVVDLVQIECLVLGSTVFDLDTPQGDTGEIHFSKGQIVHATTGRKTGVVALEEIATWPSSEIRVTDLPEEGPKSIDLPWTVLLLSLVRQLAERDRRKAAELATREQSLAPKNGKKILVIDDTEMLRVFVADVLATAGRDFQIFTASTGGEGLALAANIRPDLVLLDYSLSDMTGDKVCAALLQTEVTAHIPVLMMSGHLTELARTAEEHKNVVAALPKPFLSGALINEVEKALAAGPMPQAPAEKAVPKPAPASATPPAENLKPSLPNGHEPAGDGAAAKVAPPTSAAQLSALLALPLPVPTVGSPKPSQPVSETAAATPPLVRQTDAKVTFAFDVVALELTPWLQIAAARLEPIHRFVGVQMENNLALQIGFRFGGIELGEETEIESLRLIPTEQFIPLPAAANSLAIGKINILPANHHLEIEATRERSMRVQLIGSFTLAAVELTPGFQVGNMVLLARERKVFLRNDANEPGTPFVLEKVELDPAGELRSLFVRPAA